MLDADTLRRLSPLLDEALDLNAAQRERWIAELQTRDPEMGTVVHSLLKLHPLQETNDLLERRPEFALAASQAEHDTAQFRAGDSVGSYRLLRELGRGGMGDVWLAERADGSLKRTVALKLPVLTLRRNVLVQRFERERDILGALAHPHIARLYDAGMDHDGQPYLALEYVQGQPITRYADAQTLDSAARVRLLLQVMDAVQYAHANLVIHRDLKPGNILVTAEGKALLLDFGIAKLLEEDLPDAHESELTRMGGRALTLQYAAPEQLTGGPISIATDVWALGVLLYELLTGLRPFGVDGGDVAFAIRNTDAARPTLRRAGVMGKLPKVLAVDIDTIVLKALKKAPSERYATVSAFSDDLNRWLLGEPVHAQRDSTWYRGRKFVGRHRLVVGTATLALGAVLATAGVAVAFGLQARDESARAIAARDFLIDMFRQVDPEISHGKDITARQLLDQGTRNILSTQTLPPLLQSELLKGIADAQASMGEYKKADITLGEVVKRYEMLAMVTRAGEAKLQRASVVYLAGDVKRAEQFLVEAGALLSDEHASIGSLVRLYQLQSSIEQTKGDTASARKASLKSLELAQQAFGVDDEKAIQALATVARIEGASSDYNAARVHFDEAIERAGRNAAIPRKKVIWMQAERAHVNSAAGKFRVAAQELSEVAARCAQTLDRLGVTCSALSRAEASMWLDLGFNAKAMQLLPAFSDRIENEESPQDQVDALMTACRILIRNHATLEHAQWWDRLRAFSQSDSKAGIPERFKLSALLVQAERFLQESKPLAAKQVLQELEQRNDANATPWHRLRVQIGLYQGLVEHQLGHYDAALSVMRTAAADYEKRLSASHPRAALMSVNQVPTLLSLKRGTEAVAVLDHALPILQEAMGASSPTWIRIKALREELVTPSNKEHPAAREVNLFL